jgi:maltooligosyltrehalose trehalohydrolase
MELEAVMEAPRLLGALPLDEEHTSFLVWAPRVAAVAVHLLDEDRYVELECVDGGYFAQVIDSVAAGARYRYRLDDGPELADPCSRSQPEGVSGPSEVVDLKAFPWRDEAFVPVPASQLVIYELHVGTFSEQGTLDGAIAHLDDLVELGVNAVELMPVGQFPGTRNWGYDGVFIFAVQDSYGGPAALQRFVEACHHRGLAVVLDVVYNHFGPEGNVLEEFGPYVTDRYSTPWGPAVNVDQADSDEVRRFLIENALMYLRDFHVDALRLDAVHGIIDQSAHPFLAELAETTAAYSASCGQPLVLIAESADNAPRVLAPTSLGGFGMHAQWSDDFHHSLHVILTGERDGYYVDYGQPSQLARAMEEGFSFQGEYSIFRSRRHGARPALAGPHRFVVCAQNHDQVGNRRGGERLSSLLDTARLRLAAALVLLSPSTPLLFMGEEYGETAPFPYFIDHAGDELIEAVRRGRAAESGAEDLFDAAAKETFLLAKLDRSAATAPVHYAVRALYQGLISTRREIDLFTDPSAIWTEVHAEGSVIVLARTGRSGSLLSLFNTGDGTELLQIPGAGAWHKVVDSGASELGGDGAVFPGAVEPDDHLALPPFSFVSYLHPERIDSHPRLAG